MNYKNRMKTFAFVLKRNFNCSIELFDDYFDVTYKNKVYQFDIKYDYMLNVNNCNFFDMSKMSEIDIIEFFIQIISECDFEEEIK